MPKTLLHRLAPDSIREFRAAAVKRFDEGCVLADEDHRLAAIYLWGYAVEMTLKAAFFSQLGVNETQPLGHNEFDLATHEAKSLQIVNWPRHGRHHKLDLWAELIVVRRLANGIPYPRAKFSKSLELNVEVFSTIWNETLRYHKNRAHPAELREARSAVKWILDNSTEI